jgi:hypothetical protein
MVDDEQTTTPVTEPLPPAEPLGSVAISTQPKT